MECEWYKIECYKDNEGRDVYTVMAKDEHDEWWDLNAAGEPCRTIEELAGFVRETRKQGVALPAVKVRLYNGGRLLGLGRWTTCGLDEAAREIAGYTQTTGEIPVVEFEVEEV